MIERALIFYISQNSGHFHAANAIEKGFSEVAPSLKVEKLNTFSYTNPILEKIINKAYLGIIQKRPDFWGRIYDDPEVLSRLRFAREKLHERNMPKISRLIEERSPDVIICTQALPCGMVADYKTKFSNKLKLIGVLTDFAPHSYWIFEEVDFYVVPSLSCKQKFIEKGIPDQKIRILGIPTDPKFSYSLSKLKARENLGLRSDLRTVLMMGGTQGLGLMASSVEAFLDDRRSGWQLLVVTGKNKKLFRNLMKIARKYPSDRLKVFQFVDFIDILMDAADVIVTKAGGMTIAESITKKIPLVIISPIPGQERMNTDYLTEEGAAVEVDSPLALCDQINFLFDEEGKIDGMKEACSKIVLPESSVNIAKLAKREV